MQDIIGRLTAVPRRFKLLDGDGAVLCKDGQSRYSVASRAEDAQAERLIADRLGVPIGDGAQIVLTLAPAPADLPNSEQ